MAFEGIINENEFYSQHYLDENLNEDIKAWQKEQDSKRRKEKEEGLGEASSSQTQSFEEAADVALLTSSAARLLKQIDEVGKISDTAERVEATEEVVSALMQALKLPRNRSIDISADGAIVPLFAEKKSPSEEPYLWIFVSVAKNRGEELDPLNQPIQPEQFAEPNDAELKEFRDHKDDSWLEILSKHVLGLSNCPRWIILAGAEEWVLIDKIKFAQRRVLRFNWREILSRRSSTVLKVVSYLLGNDAFAEEDGSFRLARLEERSFKHAQGVSNDLKYALREAVELLGNEAADQLREIAQNNKKGFYTKLSAEELSAECLRYLYRLLFIFFIESRPDLQYSPMSDMHYVDGYSLEFLRDLEMVPLVSKEDQEGHYLHESISRLFKFFTKGTPKSLDPLLADQSAAELFEITPVPSSLFDDRKMPLLKQVVFTNKTLQRVIELMSLSRPKPGKGAGKKNARRGRISYAHLGLNQLGAVYETLLSFRGFFAKEDLYEVRKAEDKSADILSAAYFVPAKDLELYSEGERVYDRDEKGNKKLRVYPKGTFIYRMAGSERENSASYYTPEVLTKCLVKYALQTLKEQQLDSLPDDKSKAEKILTWRVCEPAMGSAAFINEAVNQIASLYMFHAMRVPGAKELTQDQYAQELQKVKMYIADKNIYGVDLNPVAVELAEVSIWLNAVSKDHHIPWFGLQLHCGNSLIGCRRNAYKTSELEKKGVRKAKIYNFDREELPAGYIWQFLLPHPEMSSYKDKAIEALESEHIKLLRQKVKLLNQRFSDAELMRLELLSVQIDLLWQKWAKKLQQFEEQTTDSYSIYGHREENKHNLLYAQKEEIREKAKYGDGSLDSGEFARIKAVLDYWCTLWGWPIEKADLFPTREAWQRDLETILASEGSKTNTIQVDLFEEYNYSSIEEAQEIQDPKKRRERLGKLLPTFGVVNEVSEAQKFLHWPLRFAQIFLRGKEENRGFDLTVGNPPWADVKWDAASVLGESKPIFVIHDKEYSAKGINDVILGTRERDDEGKALLQRDPAIKDELLKKFEVTNLTMNFFNCLQIYPLVEGTRRNLFKIFLPVVWQNSTQLGVQGVLHPETPYTETNGLQLRSEIYHRLRLHFHFENTLGLFQDIHRMNEFSVNIYGEYNQESNFASINNLFIPETVDQVFERKDEDKEIDSRLNGAGKPETRGNSKRLIQLNQETLRSAGEIFGSGSRAPQLPYFFNQRAFDIALKFSDESQNQKKRLVEESGDFLIWKMWNETEAKQWGIIRELPGNSTEFPKETWKTILNGPHIFVGNPLFKCPRNPCLSNGSWDLLGLEGLPDDYLPRVKYLPMDETFEAYRARTQTLPWTKDKEEIKFIDAYRLAYREMVNPGNERTLIPCVIPPGFGHVNILNSIAFKTLESLLLTTAAFVSIPTDYYVRLQNKGNLLPKLVLNIPLPIFSDALKAKLISRVLALNSLTSHYADLWKQVWDDEFKKDQWSSEMSVIDQSYFANLTGEWSRECGLRSDLTRRQALLELDVLVAQAYGFTLKDLLYMYRNGFTVMRKYEEGTYFDQNGRIVFTPNSGGLTGAGLPRKAKAEEGVTYAINGNVREEGLGFETVVNMTSGTVSKTFMDDTLPGGPKKRTVEYVAPFFKMNREEDYRRAWAFFEEKEKE